MTTRGATTNLIMTENMLANHKKILTVLLLGAVCAKGAVDITIEKTPEGKVPVSMRALRTEGAAGRLFASTLRSNLQRSGWFRLVPETGYAGVQIGGEAVSDRQDGVRTSVEVTWPGGGLSWRENSAESEIRRQAHLLADKIVEQVIGRPGMAASRIAMIGRIDGITEIYACDADGGSMLRLTRDGSLSLVPRWTPDGKGLYYTGYLRGYPGVYHLDLERNRRRLVAGFPGLNTGATVSPDGRHLALVLSRTGNPELYVMNLASEKLVRLTFTPYAVEASPSWSPDGRKIVYVSNTPGMPHLYIIGADASQRQPRRLTFRNRENVSPDWGPDGRIAFATRVGSGYQIAIINPDGSGMTQLTEGPASYEEPTWAPNGRHIACVKTENYRSSIVIIDTMGDDAVRLHDLPGDWFTPNWSPR